ncbi:gliding motility-associated C-terminal domain-containing protein [Belliella sp. DSM 107340]|uniref:Gliding motility-associated C-terminal domain-containing protein n=1 Tax=Belliella calami TaxID=2923436 RepID=A0ABS9UPR7_9BACT|nr:gliding motility-associated C-terminal domain-containing protein [Belliella calami]MCH7398617.1 gliding motility-associated C-terminal domain-containing protein [Belliella calami]
MKNNSRKYGVTLLKGTFLLVLLGAFHALFSLDILAQADNEAHLFTSKPPKELTSPEASVGNIIVNVSGKLALCSHGERGNIVLDVQGGIEPYTYRWNNNETTKNREGLLSGTYTVYIKDSRGTEHAERIVIQPPFPLIIEMADIIHGTCENNNLGSAKINVKIGRGEPYKVEWSHGLTNKMEAWNLPAGDYSVTVYDVFNCSTSLSFRITSESEPIDISENILDSGCGEDQKGSIQLDISGGQAPFTYKWSNGQITKDIFNLTAGEYTVNVQDSKGCTLRKSFVVNQKSTSEPLRLELLEVIHPGCHGGNEGAIEVAIIGGQPPFQVNWSDGVEDVLKRENLKAGVYTLFVKDDFGCTVSQEVVIQESEKLKARIDNTLDINCATGEVKGSAWVLISGGESPYSIKWNTGEIGLETNFFSSGFLSVEITDANGCKTTEEVDVIFPGSTPLSRLDFSYRKLEFHLDSDVFTNDPVQFESKIGDEFITWDWDFGDGTTSVERSPVHTFENSGLFDVKLTAYNIFGCATVEVNSIQVDAQTELLVMPNAFSPNGDGLNDKFVPVMKGISSFEMNIFNHWGEHIYGEAGLEINGWDGFFKGSLLPQGNYVYKVTYTLPDGEIINKTGGVALIR